MWVGGGGGGSVTWTSAVAMVTHVYDPKEERDWPARKEGEKGRRTCKEGDRGLYGAIDRRITQCID